jgi:hypothetical protein
MNEDMRSLIFNFSSCFGKFRVPRITLKLGGLGFFELSYKTLTLLLIIHRSLRSTITTSFWGLLDIYLVFSNISKNLFYSLLTMLVN